MTIMPPEPIMDPASLRYQINRRIQVFFGYAAAGRTPGLNSLKLLALGNTSSNLKIMSRSAVPSGTSTRPVLLPYLPGRISWCPVIRTSDGIVPIDTVINKKRNIGPGLHIIKARWLIPKSFFSGMNILWSGLTHIPSIAVIKALDSPETNAPALYVL